MSDEEFEKFEITDHDLATEFNPNRYRKNFSKNQQTYGIWAADSDEDVDEKPARRGFGANGSGGSSGYSGSVAFVSAGIQQPVKKEDAALKDEPEEEEEEGPDISSSEEEVDIIITKSIMGQKKKTVNVEFSQLAGMRKKASDGTTKGFEMYGKGAKLAMAMGYQPGKGLGKDLQGIAAPIEAHKRKGRGAIGAYGREVKSRIADSMVEDEHASTKPSISQPPIEHKWQKDGSKKNKNEKIEYQYVTAEDVLKQKNFILRPDAGSLAKVKVIDLTGPQQRILSGYHAIAGQQKPKDEWEAENQQQESVAKFTMTKKPAFEMPELIHNINLLKDSCEQDILRNEKKNKYAKERKETLINEMKDMKNTIVNENQLINNLDTLINKVKVLHETPNMDLDLAFVSIGKLKRDHPEEWELYQLYNLVPAIAMPLLKEKLKLWNPLESPQTPLPFFTDWANLLGNRGDIFEWLLWETWMPSIRAAVSYWNVKDADSLLNVFETWKPLVANWITTNLLDQFILPKMKEGVDTWDPLSDPVPIHGWIHPWLPYLGCKLEIVYPTIREKLSNALTKWHPCDDSAKKILTPWIPVFTKGSMDAFLLKNIVPKLHRAMQELIIVPHCPQNLEPWNWVMNWLDLVPVKAVVHILETVFFPNWLQFLVNWLSHMPNFEEVYRWYKWWREVFPPELARDSSVTANLKKALDMISRAVQNPGQPFDLTGIMGAPPGHPANMPPQMQVPMGATEVMADAMRMTAQVPQSFRDLVQMKCEELGVLFIPVPNRYYEAKQVYRCGNVFVYISANVIFVHKDGIWQPTSLNQLIHAATN